MVMHAVETSHLMCLSFSDLSVWCNGCEAYVDHERSFLAKDALHRAKFDGKPLPEESKPKGGGTMQIEMG